MTLQRSFRNSLLGALLAGGLLALSGPPLSFVALPGGAGLAAVPAFLFAPLSLFAIRSHGPLRAAALGGLAGLVFNLYSLRFTFQVLARFAELGAFAALPIYLLLCALQSVPLALAFGLARATAAPDGKGLYITFPLALACAFGLTPSLFPWHLGHFTLPWLAWVQSAEVGGLPLVDLLTALPGALFFEWLRRRWEEQRAQAPTSTPRPTRKRARTSRRLATKRLPLWIAVAVFAPASFGYLRLAQVDALRERSPMLPIGVVQPNVTVADASGALPPLERLERLRSLTRRARDAGAAFTVWPEAAYPYGVDRAALMWRDEAALPGLLRDAPVVLGAMSEAGTCQRWNSIVATDERGVPLTHVDKQELFPFAEYIPFWAYSASLRERYPCAGELRGAGDAVVQLPSARVGLLNCYEDVHPELARRATRGGAEVLLNLSNDAWFGDSVQPELHRIVARFRAIETRRDLIRAVNTGGSTHVSATGEELTILPRHELGFFVAPVRRLVIATPSAFLGSWVPTSAGVILLLMLAYTRRVWRRGGQRGKVIASGG